MQVIIKILLLSLGLVSCATSKDSRYRDTSMLELPPDLAGSKNAGEPPRIADTSSIPKKRDESGLGSAVYLTTTTPPQLKIKQSFIDAWNTLGLALKQSDIEITDREHDKGRYYVNYDPSGSFFRKKQNEAIYVLTVESDGTETKITATLGSATEQSSAGSRGTIKDDSDSQSTDGAKKLLQSLYETLHDELKAE